MSFLSSSFSSSQLFSDGEYSAEAMKDEEPDDSDHDIFCFGHIKDEEQVRSNDFEEEEEEEEVEQEKSNDLEGTEGDEGEEKEEEEEEEEEEEAVGEGEEEEEEEGEEEEEEEEEEEAEGEGGGGEEEEVVEEVAAEELPPPLTPPKRPRNQSLDRISTLPDKVLLHILSFVPAKEAVRTRALSKRWEYLCTSLSTLVFENFDFEEIKIRNFVTFVNHTLLLCKCSNIKKLVLDFRYKHCFATDINLWIRFAAHNNVEHLYLRLGFSRVETDGYRLPQHLFTNSSLTNLSVLNCVVAPNGYVSWTSLKRLSLEYVKLRDELIAKVFSGCPVLEFLELNSFTGINHLNIDSVSVKKVVIQHSVVGRNDESVLEISAPNLQSLELLGTFHRRKCRLVNVSSLVEANLSLTFDETCGRDSEDDNLKQWNQLKELLEGVQHVKELQLGTWCIQVLSIAEVKGLPSPMSSCKHLTLYTYVKKWNIPGIESMLRSSPNLETLVVDMSSVYHERSYDFDGESYWKSHKRIVKCWTMQVKTIKIVGFWDVREGFALSLVQFLLENAKVLEKMVIKTGNSVGIRSDLLQSQQSSQSSDAATSTLKSSLVKSSSPLHQDSRRKQLLRK
ncbi:putative F-box/LRR-repeat protein [Camellia lanceoleosa]|uniref:F-box/LRR-repeat protein n=1 Tax=Camellia lanceoleosa TaxID=1840588 RepID=A0ACC0GJ76_9ERIC|nr:putative F-box/LRR-repeat protein [Camellia lanceoleosa]